MNAARTLVLMLAVCAAMAAHGLTHRALVFGLGKQQDPSWGRIHGDNDVRYVVEMLQRMGYTDVRTLTNEKATKQGMVQAFMDLAARCRRGDVVYVHYSGHGQLMTDLDGDEAKRWTGSHAGWDEAWIPYDAYMTYCREDRGEKHFCDDEVSKYLQVIRQCIGQKGQLTVVIDACHSGDATRGEDDECVRGVDQKFNMPRQADTPQAETPAEEQWMTISACRPYEVCTEIKGKHVGKLTYALWTLGRKAWMRKAGELEELLRKTVAGYEGRVKQTPMVRGRK